MTGLLGNLVDNHDKNNTAVIVIEKKSASSRMDTTEAHEPRGTGLDNQGTRPAAKERPMSKIEYTAEGDVDTPALDHWLTENDDSSVVLTAYKSGHNEHGAHLSGFEAQRVVAIAPGIWVSHGNGADGLTKLAALAALNETIKSEAAAIMGAS